MIIVIAPSPLAFLPLSASSSSKLACKPQTLRASTEHVDRQTVCLKLNLVAGMNLFQALERGNLSPILAFSSVGLGLEEQERAASVASQFNFTPAYRISTNH